MSPWSCVQLSDPHVVEPGRWCNDAVDTETHLRAAVAFVGRLDPTPDLVLVTGDLTNHGTPAQLDHLAELLAPLAPPVRLLPGNHDDPAAVHARFPDQPWRAGRMDGVVEGPVRVVTLDSTVPGEPGGDLRPDQLEWLDATLSAHPEAPTLVALHHPPFATGIAHMDAMGLAADAAVGLAQVIGRHPQVAHVASGHLHRSITVRFAGTVASTAPSTAMAVALDLADGPAAWTTEPPMAVVHTWVEGSGLVSHLAPIGTHEPHRF